MAVGGGRSWGEKGGHIPMRSVANWAPAELDFSNHMSASTAVPVVELGLFWAGWAHFRPKLKEVKMSRPSSTRVRIYEIHTILSNIFTHQYSPRYLQNYFYGCWVNVIFRHRYRYPYPTDPFSSSTVYTSILIP